MSDWLSCSSVAGIEPVFVGCSYREMQANLELQWSGLTPSRRKAVRRQALRLISEAQGLENAADQLVPRPLQQKVRGGRRPSNPLLGKCPPHPRRRHAVRSAGRVSASRSVASQATRPPSNCARCRRTRGWSSTPVRRGDLGLSHLGSSRPQLLSDESRIASTHTGHQCHPPNCTRNPI